MYDVMRAVYVGSMCLFQIEYNCDMDTSNAFGSFNPHNTINMAFEMGALDLVCGKKLM
jgi:hypothetical protein